MSTVSRWGATALRALPAEAAHRAALQALNLGLVPTSPKVTTPRLETTLAGLTLPNPLGLAAGFDKNAEALSPLARMGFGFVEVGAATPKPQPGNAKPRLFRLTQDQAAINRFGFNNDGMHDIADRLAARPKDLCLGLNLGANKDSPDRAADYASVLKHCAAHLDFATVNVSSPNTERLRDLQGREALAALLDGVAEANSTGVLLFLKIAPDLDEAALDDICEVAQNAALSGIIATNTTLSREGLKSGLKRESGGLSGAPLFERSTRVLAQLSQRLQGRLPLIGVGGVSSGAQAYAKIKAGATAVQLYTGLVYHGMGLVPQILKELDELLAADGFETVSQAVGTDLDPWL